MTPRAGGTCGPRLVDAPDADALGDLWLAVTRAGGAVGFPPDAPEQDIRDKAAGTVADVRAGRAHMLALGDDGELDGVVFVVPGQGAVLGHRGTVVRLMVRPDLQGKGDGGALLEAAARLATTLGLEQLLLSARGGTGLPEFYRRQGWTQVGLFPGALRLGPDDLRDEYWFQKRLP
ncbi:MAG: GNAT family N-acetyltransferase [Pseudonocardia sp.]|nr:GNAT family N-acetyltransferase [Pseudonocardia sp.]